MTASHDRVIRRVISTTREHPRWKEVAITQHVAAQLKTAKAGLFQNELDYRILAPRLSPAGYKDKRPTRYRADLVGFTPAGFTITEFKIWDERRRTMNVWGVLSYILRDIRKLNELRRRRASRLWGRVHLVAAVRNTNGARSPEQEALMWSAKRAGRGTAPRYPGVRSYAYFPVLHVARRFIQEKRSDGWSVAVTRVGDVAFLVASAPL